MEVKKIYRYPLPGIPIVESERVPEIGDVLLGYEVVHDFDRKTFVKPDPKRLNTLGWLSVVMCFLCFWPATCVPCCLSCSYSKCQRPVYGKNVEPSWYLVKDIQIEQKKDVSLKKAAE